MTATRCHVNVDEIVRRVGMDGWCIIPGVIPADEVAGVREMVIEEETRTRKEHEAHVRETRARGHRLSGQGIGSATGLVSLLPDISKYLASEQLLGPAEAMLGQHVRISTVTALINNPGVQRGYWHSDWPFNQTVASHVPAPYPDAVMHLSSIFMLTEFSKETGGTLIVPGSHRWPDNPSGDNGVDADAPYPSEMTVVGGPGDTVFYDSRLWHSVAENPGTTARVAISVRYAPWWLNLNVQREGHPDREGIVVETNGKDHVNPTVPRATYEALPERARPLFRHWLEQS
jgi:ectoine hydroxylase-related dioxygenase (phytanoyl-CoA dioxygenase family)